MERLYTKPRKSRALGTGLPQCLAGAGVSPFNLISGCPLECNYCKYRERDRSGEDRVYIYTHLPRQLSDELDVLSRKGVLPAMVLFNTATEPFVGNPQINRLAADCLTVLFSRGIYVNITTKGIVPDEVVKVLAARPELVTVTGSIASLSESFHRLFEPRVAVPSDRLRSLRRLFDEGVPVRGRIEPLIPMENDSPTQVEELLLQFRAAGVREVVIAYMQMGHDVVQRIGRRVSRVQVAMLAPWYRDRQGNPSSLVDPAYRKRKYAEFKDIGDRIGVRVIVCACRNADIYQGRCFVMPAVLKRAEDSSLLVTEHTAKRPRPR